MVIPAILLRIPHSWIRAQCLTTIVSCNSLRKTLSLSLDEAEVVVASHDPLKDCGWTNPLTRLGGAL